MQPTPAFDPQPATLEGTHVRLEPMTLAHAELLAAVGAGKGIFRYFPLEMDSAESIRGYVQYCVSGMERGDSVTFATVERASGQAIGSTSFLAIDRAHRRLEIGGTWIAPDWQRTACNTEAKYLQMRHCFEDLGALRVEFKSDSLNEPSRNALLRIGAKEEGTMRNHMLVPPSGRNRHSVYFSVIASEWPDVKARLEAMLAR